MSIRKLRCRAVRIGTTVLFLTLVLMIFAQRQVAEIDFNDDDGWVVQNADLVDGDEFLGRLLLADDVAMPEAPRQTSVVSWVAPDLTVPQPLAPPLPSHATRAPPEQLPPALT